MKAARPVRCVVAAALLAAAGCAEPEAIRILDEPTGTRPTAPPVPADQKAYRTLAAMIPGETGGERPRWWFFKFSGKSEVVAKYAGDFDELIASVRTHPDPTAPIDWNLAGKWVEQKGESEMRFATLRPRPAQPPMFLFGPGGGLGVLPPVWDAELSVTFFGGHVLSNVQRWWGQLWGKDKETEITAALLHEYARQQTLNGRLVLQVDLYGPKDPNAARPGMMGPHAGMMSPHGQ